MKNKCPIEGFDEARYLALNPDVNDAVKKGDCATGWEHYVSFGYDENRPGGPVRIDNKIKKLLDTSAAIPTPPPHLRIRVHNTDVSTYNGLGRLVSCNIYVAIQQASIELTEHSRILDFGCGCGRVLGSIQYLFDQCDFTGTDIDGEAISWCQNNLSNLGTFVTNQEWPPLSFPDEFFDIVYSISVFTHLPEKMQFAWLQELQRVTKKGGHLLLTTHGEELFPASSPEAKRRLREDGFFYSVDQGTEGLPDFYQTTFHTEKYIMDRWSKYFEIKEIVKKGVANHQDLVVCTRR